MSASSKQPYIRATTLIDLLATRHNADVFVSECKTGASDSAMQRMDALAMRKSYEHPCVTAYEVKVSRGDFLSDKKWIGYLPYCNELYFVAPSGIIQPNEVPEEAGLLVCTANATRLYRKKRASYRAVEIPGDLFRYILFSRSIIHDPTYLPGQENTVTYWRQWLRGKQDLKVLGHRVSRTLQTRLREEIERRDETQGDLDRKIERLHDAKEVLEKLGLMEYSLVPSEWEIEAKLKALRAAVPAELVRGVGDAIRALNRLEERLAELQEADTP